MAATLSDKLIILDTTLRDGEQAPGIALSPDDKVAIAHQLARLQVDVIEAGFAASSPGDLEAVSRIAGRCKGPVIASLARTLADDIDAAADARSGGRPETDPRLHLDISDPREQMLRMSRGRGSQGDHRIGHRAKRYCDDVEFSPQDATRTHPDFVIESCRRAVAAGATTINIPDTVGYAVPSDFVASDGAGVRRGTRRQRTTSSSRRTATTISAWPLPTRCRRFMPEPARSKEPINGLGERAGNTSTEEIIMAVKTREDYFGVEIGADTTQIFETSRSGRASHRIPDPIQQGDRGQKRVRP